MAIRKFVEKKFNSVPCKHQLHFQPILTITPSDGSFNFGSQFRRYFQFRTNSVKSETQIPRKFSLYIVLGISNIKIPKSNLLLKLSVLFQISIKSSFLALRSSQYYSSYLNGEFETSSFIPNYRPFSSLDELIHELSFTITSVLLISYTNVNNSISQTSSSPVCFNLSAQNRTRAHP